MHYGSRVPHGKCGPEQLGGYCGEILWMLRRRRIYFGARSAVHQCRLHTKLLCRDTGREEEYATSDSNMLPINNLHFSTERPKLLVSVHSPRDPQAFGGKR